VNPKQLNPATEGWLKYLAQNYAVLLYAGLVDIPEDVIESARPTQNRQIRLSRTGLETWSRSAWLAAQRLN
jgi:hypothetical protein